MTKMQILFYHWPLCPDFVLCNDPDPLDPVAKLFREVSEISLSSAVADNPYREVISFIPKITRSIKI